METGIKGKVKGKVIKEKELMVKRKDKLKFNFLEAKQDKRLFALMFIEFTVSVAIALSIYFYLDPETNVVPFPFGIIIFAVLMGLFAVVFHKTKEFREERKTKNQANS